MRVFDGVLLLDCWCCVATPFSFQAKNLNKRAATQQLWSWRRSSNIRWKGHSKCFSIAIIFEKTWLIPEWLFALCIVRACVCVQKPTSSCGRNYVIFVILLMAGDPDREGQRRKGKWRFWIVNGAKVWPYLLSDYWKCNLFFIDPIIIEANEMSSSASNE